MYKVFIFLTKDHEHKEMKFFEDVLRVIEKDNLKLKEYSDNFYFVDVQDKGKFKEVDTESIEYINEYCNKIKKYLDKETLEYNKKFVVAIHPPGSKENISELLEWQKKGNNLNRELKNYLFDIVYYSRIDMHNIFVTNHMDYNYEYETLFDSSTEEIKRERFKKLINLLEARAEGKEIEFFDLKKKIDDLYHVFSIKALACKGIMECIEDENYGETRNYQLQSFKNKSFIEILKELKKDKEYIDDRINGKLNELNPEYYEGLSYYEQLSQYFNWYKEFLIILVDKKKEVEKGE
ncbi:MAG: hypothetical protein PVH61_09240 [Candidatus Aminicenantes bacterium]|jgi:hypothetical protein